MSVWTGSPGSRPGDGARARGAAVRPRRLRRTAALRSMVREVRLSPEQLIQPCFVHPAGIPPEPVESMPGVMRWPVDRVEQAASEALEAGVQAVLLFGIPASKDPRGSGADDPEGVVQQAVRRLKQRLPELVVITDVCLCEYTEHGHCGILRERRGQVEVDNDATLPRLAATALSHARAGADVVAPSAMMDGQVAAIREALDAEGYEDVAIMGYSAKFASAFYGPFREAAGSAPAFGDRRAYQMDPPNAREALREVDLDLAQGADIVMVKPALAYLDVLRQLRDRTTVPLAAYNVSGEYAMVEAAAARGWIDRRPIVLEMLTSMARAGADLIITYYASQAARWLREG
ncbi:porphobilinogen synthase [Carboxydochorda subterranea]|uniref:Delta-aminolevulinic acid dehydratase n=1 Tax=Carboxydichorda subterranea TaxID=3109565 RepID=A0ABZ1BW55_9FIRM|nr:porphobilinogen synthase [Limnochorda sp. L945t]WRP16818.1 porphobilinogen synthase [Limnochorda sp. L945t]